MKVLRWFLVATAVLGLISVRIFESRLFYDPFQNYFQLASKHAPFPGFEWSRLLLSYLLRFGLNLLLSLAIVQLLFRNNKWTVQAGILIILVFGITFPLYLYCIHTKFEVGYLFSFYMRRFVIQPLVLLLIIPLFYYRRHQLTAHL